MFTFAAALMLAVVAQEAPAHAGSPGHGPRHADGAALESDTVPLYSDLGTHRYSVTTEVSEAQRYFNQGLRLYYAFNHAESIRSFGEAQRLDPSCAMCWWGEALAWGPNINMPMDADAGAAAYAAIERAVALRDGASGREQALIVALATRYAPDAPELRAGLDSAYMQAMGELVRRYPTDNEIAVLYAESQMNLRPWDYWTAEGLPQPGMADVLSRLEEAIERDPAHPGACHFFIHAVEAVHPERAVPCAERLSNLMPGAGHLVHMPGHIYIRVGRYLDAIAANEHAVHADETYIRDQQPGVGVYTAGYYPHNYDFMAFAAAMAGREGQAVDAADRLASIVPEELMGAPGMDFLQQHATRALQLRVRFGRWDEILAAPAPTETLPHARAIWHYARGRALVATGEVEAAEAELERLRATASDPALEGVAMEFNDSRSILTIAVHVLAGRVAGARNDPDAAIEHLRNAVRVEDGLLYGEPPEWTVPVRHDLAAVLLETGRAAEAEQTCREDLAHFPENGWSLHTLAQALRAQNRVAEAADVEVRLARAWTGSDTRMPGMEPTTPR